MSIDAWVYLLWLPIGILIVGTMLAIGEKTSFMDVFDTEGFIAACLWPLLPVVLVLMVAGRLFDAITKTFRGRGEVRNNLVRDGRGKIVVGSKSRKVKW